MTTSRSLLWFALLLIHKPSPGSAAAFTPWSQPVNIIPLNTPGNELSPFLSPDGLNLFFASTRPGGQGGEDLWVAQRTTRQAGFSAPLNLGPTLNTGSAERSPALSADGRTLYFATNRPGGLGGFDIWASVRSDVSDNFGWQAPLLLGAVNTSATDAGPNSFFNATTGSALLYYASAVAGTLDLYVSLLAPDGTPGAPAAVTELNTPALDATPAVRFDGLEIIFSSNRSGSMGLWVSTRGSVSDSWGTPVSLGSEFAGGSEGFPALSSDGTELFFYSSRPGGSGGFDLYRSVRAEVPEPGSLLLGATALAFLLARGRVFRRAPRLPPLRHTRVLALIALATLGRGFVYADMVTEWNEIMLTTVAAQNSFAQARFAAITQLAVFEAVNTITGDAAPYLESTGVTSGASVDAAAITASHSVLRTYFPNASSRLDAERDRSLARIPDGPAKAGGIAVGQSAADRMIVLREKDGSQSSAAYTPLTEPGFWQPTPPGFAAASFVLWGRVTPFGILSAYQFAVPPPPSLTGAQYRRDYNEVKKVGDVMSTERPQDRSDIARFVAMTSPVQMWNRVAAQLGMAAGSSPAANARTLALVNMAISDSSVAVFTIKYHYQTWRPVTAIRAGDTDNNPGTEPNAAYTPFITTPAFPGYPSAHASASYAAKEVLEQLFGRGRHEVKLSNPALPGVNLSYTKLQQITDDIDDGRVYGGIHFRFDQEAGGILGRRVGRYVARHNLRVRVSSEDGQAEAVELRTDDVLNTNNQ